MEFSINIKTLSLLGRKFIAEKTFPVMPES